MNIMQIKLIEAEGRERAYRLRMPFRFGVKTHGRQAIMRVRIRLQDGREAEGCSAEALGAKWFDKDLALSDDENHHQLRKSLELASEAYLSSPAAAPFALFADNYDNHVAACGRLALNPLIASYGQSLVDRAILDALCRALDISFYQAMRSNLVGLTPHPVAPELDGFDMASLFHNPSMCATRWGLPTPFLFLIFRQICGSPTACLKRWRKWSRPTRIALSRSRSAAMRPRTWIG